MVVATIAVSAGIAAYESIQRLVHPIPLQNLGLVAAASIIGFIGNETVALYRIRSGRRIGSAALVADGLHARTDGITSLAVLIGAGGVGFGFPSADPIAGLGISVVILFILKDAARDIYHQLMDAVDPDLVDQIESTLKKVEGIEWVDDVRVRWVGHDLRAEGQIAVDASLTVSKGHEIGVRAHHALLHEIDRLASALVHVHPSSPHWDELHGYIDHHPSAILRRGS